MTRALRRFRLADEAGVARLFLAPELPDVGAITKRLSSGQPLLPSGVPVTFIATSVLQEVIAASTEPHVLVEGVVLPTAIHGAEDEASFDDAVAEMIACYRRFVEQNGGANLICGDEQRAQKAFLAVADQIARYNDIDLSREIETGRGPVDFKVSRGYQRRALVELKRASNSAYWNGLRIQLPTYLLAADVKVGHFVTIVEDDADMARIVDLEAVLEGLRASVQFNVHSHVIDARRRPSASKARGIG